MVTTYVLCSGVFVTSEKYIILFVRDIAKKVLSYPDIYKKHLVAFSSNLFPFFLETFRHTDGGIRYVAATSVLLHTDRKNAAKHWHH